MSPREALRHALASSSVALGLAAAIAIADPAPTFDPLSTGDPAQMVNDAAGQRLLDNDVTPAPRTDTQVWKQVAGAEWGATAASPSSVTPFSTDFYAVAFQDANHGFAGGTDEIDCGGSTIRVPVIYEYRALADDADPQWRPSWPGDCRAGEGYVGAIAWISDSGEALAVGGDGAYPEREPDIAIGADGYADPAGKARVWHFDGTAWSELEDLPPVMRGLSAVDFDPAESARLGFAGALGQLWKWNDGELTGPIDGTTTGVADNDSSQWRGAPLQFRVRQIHFVADGNRQLFAVTSGCCTAAAVGDSPQLVAWDGYGWSTTTFPPELGDRRVGIALAGADLPHTVGRPDLPDSIYAFGAARGAGFPEHFMLGALMTASTHSKGPRRASEMTQPLCVDGRGASENQSIVGLDDQGILLDAPTERARSELSSARLVAAAGDSEFTAFGLPSQGHPASPDPRQLETAGCAWAAQRVTAQYHSDGVPDWAVGELGSTATANGDAQGLVYSTVSRPALQGNTVSLPATDTHVPPDSSGVTNYQPASATSAERVEAWARSGYLLTRSYALNGVAFVPGSSIAWAVGDHGAILGMGVDAAGASAANGEPPPPAVGNPELFRAPDGSAFAPFRPGLAAQPGIVPALDQRPFVGLGSPRLEPAGAPNPVPGGPVEDLAQIAMSRDGSEGFAVGPSREAKAYVGTNRLPMTLYHYLGGRWSRCDPTGIGSQVPADPACRQLAPLLSHRDASGNHVDVYLTAIARIPLENDTDPSNDDDLELVANGSYFGDPLRPQPVLLRYRDGRWAQMSEEERGDARTPGAQDLLVLGDLAFTAPDDGWMLAERRGAGLGVVFRWDGIMWTECGVHPAACGDDPAAPRLPQNMHGSDLKPNRSVAEGIASAGDRVFIYGYRENPTLRYPLILTHDRGGSWGADPADGGLDPGWGAQALDASAGAPDVSEGGEVNALAVARRPDGGLEGWAIGKFGGVAVPEPGHPDHVGPPDAVALRLSAGRWQRFEQPGGPLDDYLGGAAHETAHVLGGVAAAGSAPNRIVVTANPAGDGYVCFVAQNSSGRIFRYDPGTDRWRVLAGRRPVDNDTVFGSGGPFGHVQALAADGVGGVWAAIKNTSSQYWGIGGQVEFFRYTDRVRKPVFTEVPGPDAGDAGRYAALAADADGRVWLGTSAGHLYRYDRVSGWDALRVPGWDPGRVVTRPSEIFALAVAPDGRGIAVGRAGRIADLSPAGVQLDPAAGSSGANGTSRDLHAAAIAPDGSAIVGGSTGTVLWRPAGGRFVRIPRPPAPTSATITGLSMPAPGRVWAAADTGQVFVGELGDDASWRWRLENVDGNRRLLAASPIGGPKLALRAIAVNADGRGFAVGDRGLVLERTGEPSAPWRRLTTGFLDHMTAIALPANGLEGTLLGGRNGLILTRTGERFREARSADYFGNPAAGSYREQTGPVAGFALVPGANDGELEAWAAFSGAGPSPTDTSPGTHADNAPNALVHYASSDDPLLHPDGRARALPDSPAPTPEEIGFAAFGGTGCLAALTSTCPDPGGTTADNEVITQRVVEELLARRGRPARFAVFTGDMVGETSLPGSGQADEHVGHGDVNTAGPVKLRRWKEFVADRLDAGGVPLMATIGGKDLSNTVTCNVSSSGTGNGCNSAPAHVPGENLMWRGVFGSASEPWGASPAVQSGDGIVLRSVADSGVALEGQARTHYAFDVIRGGTPILRVAMLDTSQRSAAVGEAAQNPAESQIAWLDGVLSSRPAGENAVVVTNSPTYSYGPGALTDSTQDASLLEGILMRNRVLALVGGRLGWNGLYWTLAPGVHHPCAGSDYPAAPPEGLPSCDTPAGAGSPPPPDAATGLADTLRGIAPPAAAPALDIAGGATGGIALTGVVAASAGTGFGPDGTASGTARQGYWHGYTVLRVRPDDPDHPLVIEQRPVFDWIAIRAATHTVHPGQRLVLRGFGREPVGRSGASAGPNTDLRLPTIRYDELNGPAITHRYDLLEADPEKPWLPKTREDLQGADNPAGYVPLDPSVATIDPMTGRVTAARSNHGRVYGIAVLSVGERTATWPLAFEPRRSYSRARTSLPVPPAVPKVRVLGFAAQSIGPPAAGPPAAAPPPIATSLNLPAPPALPGLPGSPGTVSIAPVPPAPPAPPAGQQAIPLNLAVTPVGITVPPTTGVTAQPTPPVNPSPPSGARREAKQRQAATAKSEEGGGEVASESPDALDARTQPFRRADRIKSAPAGFTPVRPRAQPSAWILGLEIGGGTALLALALALGFTIARPTPRRRPPVAPAPSWTRYSRSR